MKKESLPAECISKIEHVPTYVDVAPTVGIWRIKEIVEMQFLEIGPWTKIDMHGHEENWELWLRISTKQAYVCLKGDQHELINDSGQAIFVVAIKGKGDITYEELEEILCQAGFFVCKGSLIASEV